MSKDLLNAFHDPVRKCLIQQGKFSGCHALALNQVIPAPATLVQLGGNIYGDILAMSRYQTHYLKLRRLMVDARATRGLGF